MPLCRAIRRGFVAIIVTTTLWSLVDNPALFAVFANLRLRLQIFYNATGSLARFENKNILVNLL
jgi:hypothetical protein